MCSKSNIVPNPIRPIYPPWRNRKPKPIRNKRHKGNHDQRRIHHHRDPTNGLQEHLWDYAPSGWDLVLGNRLSKKRKVAREYFTASPTRIGGKFMKIKYLQYTDETFTVMIPSAPSYGFLGPTIRVEAGEQLEVVVFNNATRPYNLNIVGLDKYLLDDHTSNGKRPVVPGSIQTFLWDFPKEVLIGAKASLCRTNLYKSNVNEVRDIATGLLGTMLLCRPNSLLPNNQQKYVDKEFPLVYGVVNENLNWYIDESILWTLGKRGQELGILKKDKKFYNSNLMHSINGRSYGNLALEANIGDIVSFHVVGIGRDKDSSNIRVSNHSFFIGFDSLHGPVNAIESLELVPGRHVTLYSITRTVGKYEIENFNWKIYDHGAKAIFKVSMKEYSDENEVLELGRESFTIKNVFSLPIFNQFIGHTEREIEEEPEMPSVAYDPHHVDGQREYFIAAVEMDWSYGLDLDLTLNENNARKFRKVVYREFTDSSFTKMKIRSSSENHLGLLGPVIRAEIGDTIKIHFHNKGCQPFSLRPRDLMYGEGDEGKWVVENREDLAFNKIRVPDMSEPGIVWPGNKHTYTWKVSETFRSLDDKNELTMCQTSFYYSSIDPDNDINSGLLGPLLVCTKGALSGNGELHAVDREFFVSFREFDELRSWYKLENNLTTAIDNKGYLFKTINGFSAGSMPLLESSVGEVIRWNIVSLDTYIHTAHFGPNSIVKTQSSAFAEPQNQGEFSRSSSVVLAPGSAKTVIMIPAYSGIWTLRDLISLSTKSEVFCRYGIQSRGCFGPLGMESDIIVDDQISSSSVYITKGLFGLTTGQWKPSFARLHNKGHSNAWIPDRSDRDPWLQIDFGSATRITGITTQGVRVGWIKKFVTTYKLMYSLNGREWMYVKEDWSKEPKIFQGNNDDSTEVTNIISPRLVAQFLKIIVGTSRNQPALRLEVLGCTFNVECDDSLGVAWNQRSDPRVPDNAITASSIFIYKREVHWQPWFGRLDYRPSVSQNGLYAPAPAWSPRKSNRRQWIQIDLGEPTIIVAIVTQGTSYNNCKLFVRSYLLHYSKDARIWTVYKDPISKSRKILRGNVDENTPVIQRLMPAIEARFVRLQPWSWRGRIAMRVDLLGCIKKEEDVVNVKPLGEDCVMQKIGEYL